MGAVSEPVGPVTRAGWLGRRLRGRGHGRARAVGARVRHRRLDQAAVRALRERRPSPDVRNRLAVRDRRLRVESRPDRAGREDGAGRRAPVLDHRRSGSPRLDDRRASRAGAPARGRLARGRADRRSGRAERGRGDRAGREGRPSRGRSRSRRSSARRWGSARFRAPSATGSPATTSSLRPRRRRTSPATTACGTGRASDGDDLPRDGRADARRRLRRRAEAPDHARDVRALGRLLRRVLRPGAEGAHAHHPRAPRGARALRRPRLPDLADGRLPDRRACRRPARDVRQRPPHDPVVPRRAARALDPVRALRRPSRRAAAHRPAVRRERAVPRRARARAGDRLRHGPGEARDELGARHRARDPRPAEDADEDVLPVPGRVRRGGEHADVPRLPRISGRAAGDEPSCDGVDDPARPRARLRDRRASGVRAQELLLPRPPEGLSDLPVRSTILRKR